ncbi:MAG: Nitrogen permease regulator 2 [Thelocarpon superellum]|nr:MAG: Nitrogen permease regulator 2 [Thelocarpon superellum]
MIKSIFFSRFLTRQGPRVLYQVPDGSIVSSPTSTQLPLFDFDALSSFLIPRQELCDRLISVTLNRYRVLGYPVCITSRKYDRNEFIFNFAIVLEEETDASSYMTVVRKLAKLFRSLEEHGEFLSRDGGTDGADGVVGAKGKVYALCEIILEDLNNYCECMIPIDDFNTINIKLFPLYPPPPPVKAWHVPLSTVRLESLIDVNWDLTMQRVQAPRVREERGCGADDDGQIIPYIDGVNSVKRIAELADADFTLVRKCVEHLMCVHALLHALPAMHDARLADGPQIESYYGCLLMLDIFQFSAVYAPTAEIGMLFEDETMQYECATYIAATGPPLPPADILALYSSLHVRLPLRTWCIEHATRVASIDIRRFITFGCIKGFLYRVHKYAVAPSGAGAAEKRPTLAHHVATGQERGDARAAEVPLGRFVNGMHCFDEICTETQSSEKDVLKRLKDLGDVQIIHR